MDRRMLAADVQLQWGHGDGAVEERGTPLVIASATTGFNGATAMEPWKRRADRAE